MVRKNATWHCTFNKIFVFINVVFDFYNCSISIVFCLYLQEKEDTGRTGGTGMEHS